MTPITTVEGIGRRFQELASGLDVDPYYRTFHTSPQHDGSPHIEQVGAEFHFVVTERGSEFERRKTIDPDEILYWLLDGVTQIAATNHELRNRIEGTDGRENWFPFQERLLYAMKPEWGVRKQQQHFRILRDHPLRSKPFKDVGEQDVTPNA
jgi:hypothetical protein